MNRWTVFPRGLVVLAAFSLLTTPAVSSAASGTIVFLGRIVAPTYEMHVAPIALIPVRPATVATAATAELSFLGDPTNLQRATVRAEVMGKASLVMRCTDARSNQPTPSSMNGCHIGPGGGGLSVAVKGESPAATPSGIIVTLIYD